MDLEPGAPDDERWSGALDDRAAAGESRRGEGSRGSGRPGRTWLIGGLVGALLAVGLVLPAAVAAPSTRASVDQSRDTRARDWSRWVLATVEEDAVVVSWWSYSTPLWYRTVILGERPDVAVVDDRDRLDENLGSLDDVIRANLGTRPVYLVRNPSEIAALETTWELEMIADPIGQQPIYRVVGARSSGRGGGSSATVQAAIARIGA